MQPKQLVDKNDESGQQYRAYGKENWDFAENDLMRSLLASIYNLPVKEIFCHA